VDEYILTTDGDSHWFVIPANKRDEWEKYCDAAATYWEGLLTTEEPKQPGWADAVGGAPSLVKFTDYEIE
jgi:hypothetical protein